MGFIDTPVVVRYNVTHVSRGPRLVEGAPWRSRRGRGPLRGGVGEWLIPTVCKTVARKGYRGSNPLPSTISGHEVTQYIAPGRDQLAGGREAVFCVFM